MLLLFLTFGLFFRGLGKLVQPDALPGPRMLLFPRRLRTVCGAAESAKGFDNHP